MLVGWKNKSIHHNDHHHHSLLLACLVHLWTWIASFCLLCSSTGMKKIETRLLGIRSLSSSTFLHMTYVRKQKDGSRTRPQAAVVV